ncbi:MAG: hypothetical protein WCO02_07405 [Bacteroidota bacterium]
MVILSPVVTGDPMVKPGSVVCDNDKKEIIQNATQKKRLLWIFIAFKFGELLRSM